MSQHPRLTFMLLAGVTSIHSVSRSLETRSAIDFGLRVNGALASCGRVTRRLRGGGGGGGGGAGRRVALRSVE